LSSFAATSSPSAQPASASPKKFDRKTSKRRRLLAAVLAMLVLAMAGWFAFRPRTSNIVQTPEKPADDRAVTAEPPTRDVIAYEYLWKARTITTNLAKEGKERNKAIEYLEKAVARDPGFYDAWWALAVQYIHANPSDIDRINNAISVVKRLRPAAGQ